MTQDEWLRRYQQRFTERTGDDQIGQAMAAAETFEKLVEYFEEDPEGAADEEMSCWDAD